MVMPVQPGCAYFGFYSDFGDVYRGEVISYSSAVASVAAVGARDVANIAIPGQLESPTILSGHPHIRSVYGSAEFISVDMTYDNGYWGEGGGPPFYPSNFLVEIQGPGALLFELGTVYPPPTLSISHYVDSDGGQSVYLNSAGGTLFDDLTRIKIWRAEVFPGDEIIPPGAFWTDFVNAREII